MAQGFVRFTFATTPQSRDFPPYLWWRPRARMRSGTLNVPGIAALARPCEIAQQGMPDESLRWPVCVTGFGTTCWRSWMTCDQRQHGAPLARQPHMSFLAVEGETVDDGLNDIALSAARLVLRKSGAFARAESLGIER